FLLLDPSNDSLSFFSSDLPLYLVAEGTKHTSVLESSAAIQNPWNIGDVCAFHSFKNFQSEALFISTLEKSKHQSMLSLAPSLQTAVGQGESFPGFVFSLERIS